MPFKMGLKQQNLPSWFPTKRDSNQSPQVQRLGRILKFCMLEVKIVFYTFQEGNKKGTGQTGKCMPFKMGLKQQNLPSWFPTKRDSNQSPQVQRLGRILKFCMLEVKIVFYTFQEGNKKGTGQTAPMHRLFCAFVVHKHRRQVFSP